MKQSKSSKSGAEKNQTNDVHVQNVDKKEATGTEGTQTASGQNSSTLSSARKTTAPSSPIESKADSSIQNDDDLNEESPPLQTIHKLRRMLDDTDYMTSTASSRNPRDSASNTEQSRPIAGPTNQSNENFATHGTINDSRQNEDLLSNNKVENSHTTSLETPSTPATQTSNPEIEPEDRLWTSKDRSKYKKVQKRTRYVSPPIFLHSDDEQSDTDDGLGYTLPNVPVYFSDGEESEESDYAATDEEQNTIDEKQLPASSDQPMMTQPQPHMPSYPIPNDSTSGAAPEKQLAPTQEQQGMQNSLPVPPSNMYAYPGNDPQSSPQAPMMRPYNPYLYGYNHYGPYQPPYGPYLPPQQQQYPYLNPYAQQWGPSGHVLGNPSPYQPNTSAPQQSSTLAQAPQRPPPSRLSDPSRPPVKPTMTAQRRSTYAPGLGVKLPIAPYAVETTAVDMSSMVYPALPDGHASLAEAGTKLSFDAIQKISLMLVSVALACYAGVSPRTLPLTEYNLKFYENFQLVSLALISPAIKFISVFDARENDVNHAVNTFFASFVLGFPMAFMLEIVATTLIRLAVFAWFEPSIFSLAPKIPLLVIPWTLRENRYRPKRITLLAADFCASCVAAPVIEEYVKLKTLQWTTNLRKNFRWVHKTSSSKSSKRPRRRWVAEPIRQVGEADVTTANQYVTQMLAASIGFKLCDAGRRILMYTKTTDANKSFYAFCRGLFPIHELCGTMTAIGLAKRDLLGVNMPLWKLLFPAALIHGMANMRGKKPVFRWGSATPWSEMQLSPLHVLDASTLPKLLSKGFAKLMWLVLLSRVLGYCIKNYYMVNRHAVKRTTRYAGNHAAFSAELATAEMLKKK